MCRIVEPILTKESVEGFKVMLKDQEGRFISPFSGIVYSPGPVAPFDKTSPFWSDPPSTYFRTAEEMSADDSISSWNPNMKGRTAVLFLEHRAKVLARYVARKVNSAKYTTVVGIMQLGGELFWGTYGSFDNVYIGSIILSVKEIE